MEGGSAPLEAVRAIGRLAAGGPWLGFGQRAGAARFVVESASGFRDLPADQDVVLALAIAYFTEALDGAPPDLEATQSDLASLVRQLMPQEADPERRALIAEAIDAIDDGLAGDAVAEKLEAARSSRADVVDPVELLSRRVRGSGPG
ncbi:MAG TPA: hypothetical protein VL687_07985 [Methylomirabilota bacterium]|nr:hypothetical protein [Methylomirabilota bacterium]